MPVRLRLAGAGPEEASLRKLAARLGIAESVSFEGWVEHDALPEFLREMDIFAMPSVLDQAGLGAESVGDDEEAGELLESTGERLVDPRLDVFRDFVNSLDVDPDAERGS